MSSVRTFFRHCPSCGRRFEIRLEKKKEVAENTLDEQMPEVGTIAPAMSTVSARLGTPLVVQEEAPSVVDVREFQYTYKCKHCRHEWSEVRTEDRVGRAKGYTGD